MKQQCTVGLQCRQRQRASVHIHIRTTTTTTTKVFLVTRSVGSYDQVGVFRRPLTSRDFHTQRSQSSLRGEKNKNMEFDAVLQRKKTFSARGV